MVSYSRTINACLFLLALWWTGCSIFAGSTERNTRARGNYEKIQSENFMLNRQIEPSLEFWNKFGAYRDSIRRYKNQILTYTESVLHRNKPEGDLNNLLADILRWHSSRITGSRVDVSFIPYTLLQDTLKEGAVTIGDIYRIVPNEQAMMLYIVKGYKIRQLADSIAKSGGGAISGMRMRIHQSKARDILIGSESLINHKMYTLVAPQGWLTTIDQREIAEQPNDEKEVMFYTRNFGFWRYTYRSESNEERSRVLTTDLRDIIIQNLRYRKKLHPSQDNRIRM